MPDNDVQSYDSADSPDLFNPVIDGQKLPEDNDPPATPADDTVANPKLPPDHPEFDYDNDAHEAYDEGRVSATDIDATHEGPAPDIRPVDPSS